MKNGKVKGRMWLADTVLSIHGAEAVERFKRNNHKVAARRITTKWGPGL